MKACVLMSYWYLSYPLYEAMIDLYPKYEWYFVDPNEIMGKQANQSFRLNKSPKITNYKLLNIGFLDFILKSKLLSEGLKTSIFYQFYFYYEKKLIRFFLQEKFDHIIFTSDWFHSSKSIASNKSIKAKRSLVQPCFLDLYLKSKPSAQLNFKNLIKKFLLFKTHPILKITETRFGIIDKDSRLYIWDKQLCDFYIKNNREFTLISNPLYEHLLYKSTKKIKIIEKKAKVSIMPANYSINFGDLYQKIVEDQYIRLVESLIDSVDLTIKIHPNEPLDYWVKVFHMIDRSLIIKDINTQDIILNSNYIVSTNSYSCIEATLLGTPCINLSPREDLMTRSQDTRYSRKYSILNVSNYSDAVDFINKYKDRTDYKLKLKSLRILAKDLLDNTNKIQF
tara:strand:- start:974 stop:2155 length:1182 start_codon:yes stop_codon:yes gene_type:complete